MKPEALATTLLHPSSLSSGSDHTHPLLLSLQPDQILPSRVCESCLFCRERLLLQGTCSFLLHFGFLLKSAAPVSCPILAPGILGMAAFAFISLHIASHCRTLECRLHRAGILDDLVCRANEAQ